jgi:aspartate racemase
MTCHEAVDAALPQAGVVGVLGGMGPLATADFMAKIVAVTPAESDQDHVPVVVSSIPQVPDRTRAFRGEGASPLPAMIASGMRLKQAGAGLVVVPCNTAHLWFDELHEAIGLPMIHMVDAAIEEASALAGKAGRIGLMATDATLASGLYVNRGAPAARPIHWLLPTAREMLEGVMPGIEAVKSGDLESARALLVSVAQSLKSRGATAVILGCTEIPVVLNDQVSPLPVVDATAALARCAVAWAKAGGLRVDFDGTQVASETAPRPSVLPAPGVGG